MTFNVDLMDIAGLIAIGWGLGRAHGRYRRRRRAGMTVRQAMKPTGGPPKRVTRTTEVA